MNKYLLVSKLRIGYRFEIRRTAPIVAKPSLGFSEVFSTKKSGGPCQTLPSGSTVVLKFLLPAYLATGFSLSLPTHLHGRGRRGTGRRSEKVGCSRARNEERRRHRLTERLVLHFIAQYVKTCSVGRCICPAVLDPNPRLSRLGRVYSRSNSAVAQLWFQLTSFS